MKRTAIFLAVLLMLFSLCACGRKDLYDYDMTYPSGSLDDEPLEFSDTTTVIPTPYSPAATAAPAHAPVRTPAPAYGSQQSQAPVYTPVPTTAPTPVPTAPPTPAPTVNPNEVQITKSPTSETVYAGGSALFIARADRATSTNWIIVSPDAKSSYKIQDAPSHFAGLTIENEDPTRLRLNNIPTSMSGWRVQCYFTGEGGPKYTSGAYLTVLNGTPAPVGPTPFPIYTAEPQADTETLVSNLARSAGQQLYSAAQNYGYSISDITNYSYSDGQATYSMTFSNASYKIIGQFRSYYQSPSNNGSSPQYIYVYDTNGTSIRGENLSGQTFDYFTSILSQYR